jgi:hypothetical protein
VQQVAFDHVDREQSATTALRRPSGFPPKQRAMDNLFKNELHTLAFSQIGKY